EFLRGRHLDLERAVGRAGLAVAAAAGAGGGGAEDVDRHWSGSFPEVDEARPAWLCRRRGTIGSSPLPGREPHAAHRSMTPPHGKDQRKVPMLPIGPPPGPIRPHPLHRRKWGRPTSPARTP